MNADRILQIAGLVLIVAVSGVAGAQLQGCWSGDPAPQAGRSEQAAIDTTDRTRRALAPRDTVREVVTRPEERVIYETRVDTVRDCYARPKDWQPSGMIGRDPVQVDRRLFDENEVTLTYFRPEASRFEQQVYDVPAPKWEVWPSGSLAASPTGGFLMASASAHVRWRQLELVGGYGLGRLGGQTWHGPMLRLTWRPFALRW
jgi:hypothetical protein